MGARLKEWFTRYRPEKWAEVRERGKTRFVLRLGLGWALWMFIVMSILNIGFNHRPPLQTLLIGLVIWPIAGFFYGIWMWAIFERRYLHAKKSLVP